MRRGAGNRCPIRHGITGSSRRAPGRPPTQWSWTNAGAGVHPGVRRGAVALMLAIPAMLGSSRRAPGRQTLRSRRVFGSGFIPACAGAPVPLNY